MPESVLARKENIKDPDVQPATTFEAFIAPYEGLLAQNAAEIRTLEKSLAM